MLNTIDEGIKAVRQGKIVIVVDDENRENEGDFIVSGEKITPDIVNFMITHGRGLLCVPLPRSRCEELNYTRCRKTTLLFWALRSPCLST